MKIACAIAAAMLAGIASAADPSLEVMFRTRLFNQVALSPDARQLAWVRPETAAGAEHWRIYLPGTAGPADRRLMAEQGDGGYDEKEIAWSPDSRRLAFLSDRGKPGQLELYVQAIGEGEPRRLSSLDGALTRPQWSPDGSRLSFLFVAHVHGILGAGSAGAVPDGEVGEDAYVQQLMVVDAGSGSVQSVTPAGQYVYESDWSPDGREIAYTAAPAPGDDTWYHARLYVTSVGDRHVREIYRPKWQMAVPRWSPDGRSIAFIEGLMSDKGSTGGDIWIVPAKPHPGPEEFAHLGQVAAARWAAAVLRTARRRHLRRHLGSGHRRLA
jgi:Tol biopolymer transport system component